MSFLLLSRRLISRGPLSRISRRVVVGRGDEEAGSADIAVVNTELVRLASVVADWASEARLAEVYLYGSRVTGEPEPDSHVDLCFAFPVRDPAIMAWWELNQLTRFALLELKLGEQVHVIPLKDPIAEQVREAASDPDRVMHQDRNVTCVWMPGGASPP